MARSTLEKGSDALAPEPARAFLHAVPEQLVDLYAEAPLPTRHGTLRTLVFRERGTDKEHVAAVKGDLRGAEGVPVRVHSECLTSEILGSLKCDCRDQREHALDLVGRADRGAVLYLRQEGRGIGLGNKIRAYALQARGADTYEANRALGFEDDLRRYDIAACILKQLGVRSVDLITNNPLKLAGLAGEGIAVRRRIASLAPANPHNVGYLRTKRERTGHLIDLFQEDASTAANGVGGGVADRGPVVEPVPLRPR
jgi:GTP cyclohydrolase II/3,4-dihydroxy 2-butanone 4-phosphate synthase/GTP cyclohydrolase II